MIKLVLMLSMIFAMIFYGHSAYAENPKSVCVYEPMDLFMDKSLTGLIVNQVQNHKVTVKTVNIANQILHKNSDCSIIVKIDRAINENYRYTDKTEKYQINGNTITIFTYKTSAVFNPSSGGGNSAGGFGKGSGGQTFVPMTNWSCETTAHASKYQSNYHISDSGYHATSTGTCNPFKTVTDSSHTGELPYNIIRSSVDSALAKLGL